MIEQEDDVGTDPVSNPISQPITPPDMTPAPAQQPEPVANANVVLSGARSDEALSQGRLVIGQFTFDIPDEATQKTGFYVDKPGVLVAQFRQYKFLTPKGTVTPTVSI